MSTVRPMAITLVAWFLIAVGAVGVVLLVQPLADFDAAARAAAWRAETPGVLATIFLARIAAVVGGGFMLAGRNWARWLTVAWLVFHVVISVQGGRAEVAVHALLAALLVAVLFQRAASAYFRTPARPGA
jgi:hypothetical protein